MPDLREKIVEAAISLLREEGYSALTQPNVARRTGMRQSHITYYYPTRSDLLDAVAKAAVDRQLAGISRISEGEAGSDLASAISRVISNPENTRVLVALVSASDHEPAVREHFKRLVTEMRVFAGLIMTRAGAAANTNDAALLHVVATGLAITSFATGEADAGLDSATIIQATIDMIAKSK